MEAVEPEVPEGEKEDMTIDLSKQALKKIERATNDQRLAVSLILDQNEIQKLENIDSYVELKRFSIANNQLIRMYGVSALVNLTNLDISNNSLVVIEGLKDLRQLKQLNLAGNKIKSIDHLNTNIELEYLDLSDNLITHVSDISHLVELKELFLHNNRLAHLRQCDKNLPSSLETLSLSSNLIQDLNDVSHLVHLTEIKELSLKSNPCIELAGERLGFDYRPFVKNWCSTLMVLDGYPLDEIECLRAEWLYSQGRGRSFRAGEHAALVEYLSGVCPKTPGRSLENEDERKLRLILSKAQLHQQQLRLQGPAPAPSRHKLPLSKKKMAGLAERMVSSCHDVLSKDSSRGSPDLMTRSLDAAILRNSPPPTHQPNHHHQVVDILCHSPLQTATTLVPVPESLTSPDVVRPLHPLMTTPTPPRRAHPMSGPSPRSSPFSTPETKRRAQAGVLRPRNSASPLPARKGVGRAELSASPKLGRSTSANTIASPKKVAPLGTRADTVRRTHSNDKETSEEEDSEMTASKLHAIQQRASQKRHKKQHNGSNHVDNRQATEKLEKRGLEGKENAKRGKRDKEECNTDLWRAAICIQRRWRGFRTRNLNADVVTAYKDIQTNRIQDYIIKVANDMEATKVALEGNRKLQVLQMQAINALWKKMATMGVVNGAGGGGAGGGGGGGGEGPSSGGRDTLQGLAATCGVLNRQVEELQNMVRVMQHGGGLDGVAMATQTDIVAVHTPQGEGKEGFPYQPRLDRAERLERPSNLAITQPGSEPVEQFATSLATDVIKSVSSGPDSCSDSNDIVMALDDNSNFKESSLKEEPVCLTPACQEGRDLRATVGGAVSPLPVPGTVGEAEEGLASPLAASPTVKHDEFHNGCPSS